MPTRRRQLFQCDDGAMTDTKSQQERIAAARAERKRMGERESFYRNFLSLSERLPTASKFRMTSSTWLYCRTTSWAMLPPLKQESLQLPANSYFEPHEQPTYLA